MALNTAILIDRTIRELGAPATVARDVESAIPHGLQRLSTKALADAQTRAYLTKPYTLALVAGVVDLAPHDDLFLESLSGDFRTATLLHSSSDYPLQEVPTRSDLVRSRNHTFIEFTIEDGTLYTKDTAGSLTGLSGNIDVTNAVFVPVVAVDEADTTLHVNLEDDLVEILLGLLAASRVANASEQPAG